MEVVPRVSLIAAAPGRPGTAKPVSLDPGPPDPGLNLCLGPVQTDNEGDVDT